MRPIRVLTALVVLCSSLPAFASEARSHETARFRDGLLSVDFDAMPVRTALLHLERAAGISIAAPASRLNGTITMSLQSLPIERAVGIVLRAAALRNYAVLYDGERGAPKAFVILDSDSDSSAMPSILTSRDEPEGRTGPLARGVRDGATVSSEHLLARLVTNGSDAPTSW